MTDHPPEGDSGRSPLPLWARLADAVALGAGLLALVVASFGGFRLHAFGTVISLTSSVRVLSVALAVLAVRHLVIRRQPLHRRSWDALQRLWRSRDLRAVLPVWIVTRLGVLLIGFLAVGTFGYRNDTVPFRLFEDEWLNLPARYDAGWYLGIADEGYHYDPNGAGQQNIAFMPALPMLMRAAGRLVGGQQLWAGQLIVLVASLWAFLYVFRLARADLGDDERAAAAVALLAAYPFAVFYSAVYTESLFLLSSAGAFYHVTRREYGRVAALALLAGFARPNGFLLAVPLTIVAVWPALAAAWRQKTPGLAGRVWRVIGDARWAIASSAAAVAGVLVFSAYIYSISGRPFAWLEAHAAWGRTLGTWLSNGPIQDIHSYGLYSYTRSRPIDAVNGAAIIAFLLAVWPVTRRLGLGYGAFLVVNLIPPLTAGGILSIGRVTACMFPVFIWMASAIPARHRAAWLTLFALLQAWGAALFFTWREFI